MDNTNLGLGLGLRNCHFEHIVTHWPQVDWFEAISENFMDSGGRPRHIIRQIAQRYPLVLHGVSLSIGSTDPLDFNYLGKLKALAAELQPAWLSDHLCWTGVQGLNSHDLLPVPLTEQTLKHISQRILQVQDFLGRPLVLENPSSYISFKESTISEPEFLAELCQRTDCALLLDVNNVYVSCFNNDSDPFAYLQQFPFDRVVQMHLAGHQHCGTHIIDTHDRAVQPYVWALFRQAWQLSGEVSLLLEWDGNIPSFDECLAEIHKAKHYMSDDVIVSSDEDINQQLETISTPVDFLVPKVMDNTSMSETV